MLKRENGARPHRKWHARRFVPLVIIPLAIVFATVCGRTQAASTQPVSTVVHTRVVDSTPPAKVSSSRQRAAGDTPTAHRSASNLSLIIEPDAGIAPLYALLRSAHHSVDIVIYELEDNRA